MRIFIACCLVLLFGSSNAQNLFSLSGAVANNTGTVMHAAISLQPTSKKQLTNENGYFSFKKLSAGQYHLTISLVGYQSVDTTINISSKNIFLHFFLHPAYEEMEEVTVYHKQSQAAANKMADVSGTNIYAGKKSQQIILKNINANLATNNARQIYGRIPSLNIWEYNQGGLQLGIGGRGLSPSRASNFNVRQNGYDISADALGYPESYYNPSAEAVERIEIVSGAAGLQYGPQFGGLVNFVMKEGPKALPVEITLRQTAGSFNFFNSFNSIGGTVLKNKLNYYSFYQYKKGDDWRPNSHYDQHTAYLHLAYALTDNIKITAQHTTMHYLAQQPGGLTDAMFYSNPDTSVRSRNWFKVNWNLTSLNADININSRAKINWHNYLLLGSREALGILSHINRVDVGLNRDLLADKYKNFSSELRYIQQYNFLQNNLSTLLVGARVYNGLTLRKQGEADDGKNANFEFIGPEPNRSQYRFPGVNLAAFAENIFRINSRWSITPGIRLEYINTKSDGYYYKDLQFVPDEKINEKNSNPRSFVLLGVGSTYKFKNNLEAYGNISQNYRSINFNDVRIVNPNARVDSALKDERGYNMEIGFRGNYRKWLFMDISMFYLKYNDRIGSVFKKFEDSVARRFRTNISDSRNWGVEFLVDGDILKPLTQSASKYSLSIYTNLSLINARYTQSKQAAFRNKWVENAPPILLRTGVSFGNSIFNITYQLSHQAKQYSEATNTEITPSAVDGIIPAFTVMDLSLRYNILRNITMLGGINNLLNEKYFTRRADGYPGPGIIPADIRNYYLTLQVKLW